MTATTTSDRPKKLQKLPGQVRIGDHDEVEDSLLLYRPVVYPSFGPPFAQLLASRQPVGQLI